MNDFFCFQNSGSQSAKEDDTPAAQPPTDASHNHPQASTSSAHASTSTLAQADIRQFSRVERYFKADYVSKAEVIWTLQMVNNHISLLASAKQIELFPEMFPDSKIASSMRLGRTKLSYVEMG